MKTELMMTVKEADKYALMTQIESGKTAIIEASRVLGISYRQTRRLWSRYQREGPEGLISKQRGRISNNRIKDGVKEKVITIISEKYSDYGPTLAMEKLQEKHALSLSRETIRKLMIREGLWKAKRKKRKKIYARRTRRSQVGALIQIDGSYEYWFEGRAEKCCLLVFIDDATSQIMMMRFCRTETTEDYLEVVRDYVLKYGRPEAFYSDKHSIFRVNAKGCEKSLTYFHKALKGLGIELICAHSPQAKGRVERANGILQDRLIKELREEEISSMKEGNAYLETYQRKHNEKFGKEPADTKDAHRQLLPSQDLDQILIKKSERVLSKDLSFSYEGDIYQIKSDSRNRLFGKRVEIHEKRGKIEWLGIKGKRVAYSKWKERPAEGPKTVDVKELEILWPTKNRARPRKHHPWR